MSDFVDRVVTFQVTYKVSIGSHRCVVCQKKSPLPTDDQLLEVVVNAAICDDEGWGFPGHHDGGMFLWPGHRTDDCGTYIPIGWSHSDSEGLLVCDECSAARTAAFDARRKPEIKE